MRVGIQGDLFRPVFLLGNNPAPTEYGRPIYQLDECEGARGRGALLYPPALARAEEHGRAVHERARARGGKTRDGVPDVIKPIRGTTAEIAWWVASGFRWNDELAYDPHRGDCEHTEVRSVWSLSIGQGLGCWAYMPLMEEDLRLKPDMPHIVAAPLRRDLTYWWFHGWYTPREAAKHSTWWHEKQFKNCGGWRVDVADMYELSLLKDVPVL